MVVEHSQENRFDGRPNGQTNGNSPYRIRRGRGTRIKLECHSDSPDPNDISAVRQWLNRLPRPWAVDLFCGAGGLSLGLEEQGFSVVAAADSDPVAVETHAANIQSLPWTGDLADPKQFIGKLDEWGIDTVDLLAGGPPCQPFSNAGASMISKLVRNGQRNPRDKRVDLWRSFFAIVDRLKPKAVLFENVPNFAQAESGALLIALRDELRSRGFGVYIEVLKAWQYRVPQHRNRLFIVGIANNGGFNWPPVTGRRPTLKQAIGDLPVVQADSREEVLPYEGRPTSKLARFLRKGLKGAETGLIRDHITRAVRPDDAEIYDLLEPGGTYLDVPPRLRRYRSDVFSDKYFRLSFDDLSRTITAHIAKDGYWYIHPRENRTLSIREAARIQTFPDRFRFAGPPTARYKHIGNAVPPSLAASLAKSILASIDQSAVADARPKIRKADDQHTLFRGKLSKWFKESGREFPWRASDLNSWQVLIIEMCLHRTKAEQVAGVAEDILKLGQTPECFLMNSTKLEPLVNSLGLHGCFANLVSVAEFVSGQLKGNVPDNWQELVAIPSVGDYIASAVLCFANGRPAVLMDTNTIRIARRVIGDPTLPIWRLRLFLHELAGPKGAHAEWNQALLDLGAIKCTARSPKCIECPVNAHCVTGGAT